VQVVVGTHENSETLPSMLVRVANVKQQIQLHFLVGIWILSVLAFWFWWLSPSHFTDGLRFTVNTIILGWTTLLPGYYFYFLCRMKKPNPELPIPKDWRIAMVVTRAPSEPFALVKRTLLAMTAQEVPHDTWLADENPTPEIRNWCDLHHWHPIGTQNSSCAPGLKGVCGPFLAE
jgi:cellulose synthase (UDP-forming)